MKDGNSAERTRFYFNIIYCYKIWNIIYPYRQLFSTSLYDVSNALMSKFQCKRSVDNSIMSRNKLAYIILLTKFARRMMVTEKAYFFNRLMERGKWNLWTVRVHKDLTRIGNSLRFRYLKIELKRCSLKWQWAPQNTWRNGIHSFELLRDWNELRWLDEGSEGRWRRRSSSRATCSVNITLNQVLPNILEGV